MYPNILFIAMLTHCYAHSRVPVLLIDYQGSYKEKEIHQNPNPFHEISSGYFTGVVSDVIEKSDSVVVFAEENLSPEDISSQDHQGSPYTNIKRRFSLDKIMYLPAVSKPYRVLTQKLQLGAANYINLTDGNTAAVEILSQKFFYVFFKDLPGLSRIETLRRHDETMERILTNVKTYNTPNVVAFYTGIQNPAEDIAEDLPEFRRPAKTEPSLIVQSQNTMLRFTGLSMKTVMRQTLDYHGPLHAEEFTWGDTLKTRVTSQDFVLEFYFVLGKDTWLLDRVTMLEDGEEVGVTSLDVRVPWRRSFVCANPLIVVNNRDGSAIVIPEYQIEPFKHPRHTHEKQIQHGINYNKIKHFNEKNVPNNDSVGASASRPSEPWTSSILFQPTKLPDTTTTKTMLLGSTDPKPVPTTATSARPHVTTSTEPMPEGDATEIQKYFRQGDDTEQIQKYFSDAVICCHYFTAGIVMAGFVVFISGGILLVGIFGLMNGCNSNDRFDQTQQLSLFDLPASKSE